jgi:hypothetical protein
LTRKNKNKQAHRVEEVPAAPPEVVEPDMGEPAEVEVIIPDPTPTDMEASPEPILASIPEALIQTEDTPSLDELLADSSPAAEASDTPFLRTVEEILYPVKEVVTPEPEELPAPEKSALPRVVKERESAELYYETQRGIRGPRPGTFWRQDYIDDHCYEVLGVLEHFVLCDLYWHGFVRQCLVYNDHFGQEIWPYLTPPKFPNHERVQPHFGEVFPVLPNSQERGLMPYPELNAWVPVPGRWWQTNASPVVYYRSLRVLSAVETVGTGSPNDGEVVIEVEIYVDSLQKAQLGHLHLTHFLNNGLVVLDPSIQYPADWIWRMHTQPQQMPEEPSHSTPPATDEPLPPVRSIEQQCVELALELGVDRTHVERFIDGTLRTVQAIASMKELADSSPVVGGLLERLKTSPFLPQLREIVGMVSGLGGQKVPSAEAQQKIVDYINQQLEPRIDALEKEEPGPAEEHESMLDAVVKSSRETFELLRKDLDILSERVEELELPAAKAKPKSKPAAKPAKKAPKASAEARTLELFPEEPVKRPRGRPKGSKTKKKGRKAGGRLTPKAAQLSPPRSNMPKNKAKAAGRASRASRPPPNKARPLAKGPGGKGDDKLPYFQRFKALIGEPYDQKIMALLNQLPPRNRDEFLKQVKKGLPDMRLTGWNAEQQGRFAMWYFGRNAER